MTSSDSVARAYQASLAESPGYARDTLRAGIVHIGIGNFHRSHQALFLHELLQKNPGDWLIQAVGCMPNDVSLVDAMNGQDCLYTLTERSGSQDTLKVIGSIIKCLHAPSDPQAVISLLASEETKIVSLTITEKGYCSTPAGVLDLRHPMIQPDLADGATPVSALGYLFAGAERRMATHGLPFTVMSCDNLTGNGHKARAFLLAFAKAKDPLVAEWISNNVSFPNSMVDRITPQVTASASAFVRDTFAIEDNCPVIAESFRQWVLEDNFIAGRPALEEVGVQFVDDVAPYEVLKVRMLNGSHSALAYVSYLLGHRTVDEAMKDPLVEAFVQRYMDEDVTPTLPEVPGIDVEAYKRTLRERFANPAISDQIQRLAMDGSTKVGTFVLPPLAEQLRNGGSHIWLTFAVAAWLRYLTGVDEDGVAIEISDPMFEKLAPLVQGNSGDIDRMLSQREIFGDDLQLNQAFVLELKEALDDINRSGIKAALSNRLAS